MYSLNKTIMNKNVKIYVNGKALPYSWNNYVSKSDALQDIEKGNIADCNPLVDSVEIREEQSIIYRVKF